jgi:hypothetical protein
MKETNSSFSRLKQASEVNVSLMNTGPNTVKPLSIVSEGTAENKRWMGENNSCGNAF